MTLINRDNNFYQGMGYWKHKFQKVYRMTLKFIIMIGKKVKIVMHTKFKEVPILN